MFNESKFTFDQFVDAINDFIKWFTQIMTDFVGQFKKEGGIWATEADGE